MLDKILAEVFASARRGDQGDKPVVMLTSFDHIKPSPLMPAPLSLHGYPPCILDGGRRGQTRDQTWICHVFPVNGRFDGL